MVDYETRLAQATAYSARPHGKDLPNQKFKRGYRVKVTDTMPSSMSHFECGFEGIVQYTYGQKFSSNDIDNYSLVVLGNDGKPINAIAWYNEDQLTLINDDVEAGENIIAWWDNRPKNIDWDSGL